MTDAGTTFAAVGVTLYAAHQFGDYWVQTHPWATTKGRPDRAGRIACAKHVATYTMVTAALTMLVWQSFGLAVTWYSFVLGQLLSAVTHYWADRRLPLLRLVARLGKDEFARVGMPRQGPDPRHKPWPDMPSVVHYDDNPTLGTGAMALDQAWHITWLFVAAYVTAVLG